MRQGNFAYGPTRPRLVRGTIAHILPRIAQLRRSRFHPQRKAGKACRLALLATGWLWMVMPVAEPSGSFAAATENAGGIQVSIVSDLSLSCAAEGEVVPNGFVQRLAAALSVVPPSGEVREVTCLVRASNPSGFVLSWKQADGGPGDRWAGRVTANALGARLDHDAASFAESDTSVPTATTTAVYRSWVAPGPAGVRIRLRFHPVPSALDVTGRPLGVSFTAALQ
jgi:hypothetical protein